VDAPPAPPGRVYGQKDLKQAEARFVAYFANATGLIEIFQDPNANLYIKQGVHVLGLEVDKDDKRYTQMKGVIHAGHYLEGPFKMAWDMGISVTQAREFQEKYQHANPQISVWQKATKKDVMETGVLTIPVFRKRRVFYEALAFHRLHNTITDKQWKDAVAWRPQCIVPNIITQGMVVARRELPDDIWIHHHGHDSVVWSCVPGMFVQTEQVFDAALRITIPVNGYPVVIPQETTVGYTVGELMDYTGVVPTYEEWKVWRDKKLVKKPREQQVMEGIYGPHIETT